MIETFCRKIFKDRWVQGYCSLELLVEARATEGKGGGNTTKTFLIRKLMVKGGADIIAMSIIVKSVLKRDLRHN